MEQPSKYDVFAEEYSTVRTAYNQKSVTCFRSKFALDLTNKKLLDLGCGTGEDLAYFGERGAILYGIDASDAMIQFALNNTKGLADIKEGYYESIPFADNFFDVVCSKYAFQAAADLLPIYQEVNRVLKPGGTFIFLAGHPIYQFMEKKEHPKDYFKKEMIDAKLFGGKITLHEPSHTISEYLSPYFIRHFDLIDYQEEAEDSIEKINGDTYPAFFIIKATKR